MAIALSKEMVQVQTGLTLLYSYLVLFVTTFITIWVANLLFPTHVVLGTYALSPLWSLYLVVAEISVVSVFMIPLVYYYEWQRGKQYSDKEWMTLYFISNTLLVWSIARVAEKIGFGISSWFVAVLLGLALDFVQGIGMMTLGKYNKMK